MAENVVKEKERAARPKTALIQQLRKVAGPRVAF